MSHAFLFIARFCSTAWFGAAVLFVIVGVSEVTRGGFDSATKDTLVAIRFPIFYRVGVSLLLAATIGCLLTGSRSELSTFRQRMAISLLVACLCLMAADYNWVYKPLETMVVPPGQSKPINFVQFHEASKYVNLAGLCLCLLASIALNWPGGNGYPRPSTESSTHGQAKQ